MEREIEFTPAEKVAEWRQAKGAGLGIVERILNYDAATGNYSRICHFPPGTFIEGTVRHDFCEEVLVLEGSLTDLAKNVTAKPGDYACRPVGMPHGPYRTEEGFTSFEIRYQPPGMSPDPECSLLREELGKP